MVDRNPGNPSDPSNPDRNRESERQLRALLMSWDPIGVVDDPEAEDEYDCMVAPLLQQLYDATTVERLYSWIANERAEHFGMAADPLADAQLADQWCSGGLIGAEKNLTPDASDLVSRPVEIAAPAVRRDSGPSRRE